MNRTKIVNACGNDTPECDYLIEVANRLEKVLGDVLSLGECISLISILAYYSFLCSDGFIINNESDTQKMIGLSDAAAVAASFCEEPDYDWDWFKAEYSIFDKESVTFEETYSRLLRKITSTSSIQLRNYGETVK